MSEGNKDFALGMIIGGLIGAAVALLYAPMTGVDTRRRVSEKAGEFAGDARTKATEWAGSARERAGEAASSLRERAGETASSLRERAGETASTLRERAEELRNRVISSVDAGREAAQAKAEELEQRLDESASPVVPPENA